MTAGPVRRSRGFTLVELMVVVAIVGVLVTLAVVAIDPGERSSSVKGFSQEVGARLELAHQRAVANGRIHRIQIDADSVNLWQATTEGMRAPTDWLLVSQLATPPDVVIHAYDSWPHMSANDSVPSAGGGLPALIDFMPDGGAQASTIFVGSDDRKRRARVLLFSATSSVHFWDAW